MTPPCPKSPAMPKIQRELADKITAHAQLDDIRILLATGAQETEPYPISYNSEEPLRLAIRNGHFDCARLLLENGADPNAKYFLGTEVNLIAPTDTKFLKLLLMYGADPNSYDRDGLTPLMKAARHKEGLEAVQTLVEYGSYINALALERQDFRTPLHYAILSGSRKLVSYLIEQGALVNMEPEYNKPSPLDFAVLRDQVDLVDLLLAHGANPNSCQTYIGTPLHLACCSDLANQRTIIRLLLEHGADPNITPMFDNAYLKSPFVEYFRTRSEFDMEVVKLFLAYGANVIMKSPVIDPNGILRALAKIERAGQENRLLFDLLLDAGQNYDSKSIDRSALSFGRRMQLLNIATNPLSLRQLCRLAVRAHLKPMKPEKPFDLPLPKMLQNYLIYQD